MRRIKLDEAAVFLVWNFQSVHGIRCFMPIVLWSFASDTQCHQTQTIRANKVLSIYLGTTEHLSTIKSNCIAWTIHAYMAAPREEVSACCASFSTYLPQMRCYDVVTIYQILA